MTRPWMELFSPEEQAVYEAYQSGLQQRVQPYGQRPALLVIDVTRAFCGEQGQSLAESLAEWPTSCGPAAWEAMPHIEALLDATRRAGLPVVYTTAQPGAELYFGAVVKMPAGRRPVISRPGAVEIPAQIVPGDGELVLQKPKASAFFATPLVAHLQRLGVDSLLVCGTTTSGCVRATVVDGFSWGYATFVVQEAVFDRSRLSHEVNLFEMNVKYADVIPMQEALDWLGRCAAASNRRHDARTSFGRSRSTAKLSPAAAVTTNETKGLLEEDA